MIEIYINRKDSLLDMPKSVADEIRKLLTDSKQDKAQLGALEKYIDDLMTKLDRLDKWLSWHKKKKDTGSLGFIIDSLFDVWKSLSLTEKRQFRKSKEVIEELEIIEDKSDNKKLESALKKLEKEFTLEQNILLKAFSKHVGKVKEQLEEVVKKTKSCTTLDETYSKTLKHLQTDIDDLEHELEELRKFVLSSINTLQKIGETIPRLSSPKEITSFDNPNSGKIDKADKNEPNRDHLLSEYTRFLDIKKSPRAWKTIKRKLKGQVLIDLGCGADQQAVIVMASETKVAKYFGVDKIIKTNQQFIHKSTEVNILNGDLLQFASKLTTNSCNFIFSGIDFLQGDYLNLLVTEITRATRPGGIVFGRGSQPISEILRNKSKLFTEVMAFSFNDDHFLFVKN